MDAAEPDVADTQTDNAGGGLPAPRQRRKWGWFAKLSVGASILTTVLALVFALWLQRSVQTASTAGEGDGTEQGSRPTTTTTATIPKGAYYIVYDFRSRATSRAEQAAAVSLTKGALNRAGISGVQTQCLGGYVLVVISDRRQVDEVAGIINEQGLLLPQSTTERPPDTTGELVGCD